jgi:hypothetical protein
MDHKINLVLKVLKIKSIPVIHLEKNLYFIGIYKVILDIHNNYVMVKIGQKYLRFAEYIKKSLTKF